MIRSLMKGLLIAVGGFVVFCLLFIAANNITGPIIRFTGLAQPYADWFFASGIALAAVGSVIFMRTIWVRNR